MLKTLPVRRWQSRQWHIEIFDGSPSHLKAMEPQWHCVVRDVISFYSEEACIHGTERIATPLCWRPNGMSNILPKMPLPQPTTATNFDGLPRVKASKAHSEQIASAAPQ
jgi:hypothetical protein